MYRFCSSCLPVYFRLLIDKTHPNEVSPKLSTSPTQSSWWCSSCIGPSITLLEPEVLPLHQEYQTGGGANIKLQVVLPDAVQSMHYFGYPCIRHCGYSGDVKPPSCACKGCFHIRLRNDDDRKSGEPSRCLVPEVCFITGE